MISPRTLAERFSRNLVLKRRIQVGGADEPLVVTPDSQLKYLRPGGTAFDTDLVGIAEALVMDGDTVWDVGANVGTFFVSAAAKAGARGEVLAVDADAWLASLLIRTSRLTHHRQRERNMRVLCAAIGDRGGISEFRIAERGRASNSLEAAHQQSQSGGIRYRQPVAMVTLDMLLENQGAPDFVKIDVEGAEHLVFRGAERLLSMVRPLIYVEICKENFAEMSATGAANDYRVFDERGRETVEPSVSNYFFVPRDGVLAERFERAHPSLAR